MNTLIFFHSIKLPKSFRDNEHFVLNYEQNFREILQFSEFVLISNKLFVINTYSYQKYLVPSLTHFLVSNLRFRVRPDLASFVKVFSYF